MPQERTCTDECPEPIMGFQDLHPTVSRIWESIPYNIKNLPFPSFIKTV